MQGVIEASYANFGLTPYGHSMMGRLRYLNTDGYRDLCQPIPPGIIHHLDDRIRWGGEVMDEASEEERLHYYVTPWILAERGSCDFVKKVRNAEDAGAGLAIIIDNETEDVNSFEMVDDGSGAGLRIPSMLISKEDGQRITEFFATASQD